MIQATALRMVFDMLLLYGIDTFKSAAVSGSTDGEQPEDDDVMTVHSFADEANDNGQDGVDQTTQILLKILVEFLSNEVYKILFNSNIWEAIAWWWLCTGINAQKLHNLEALAHF